MISYQHKKGLPWLNFLPDQETSCFKIYFTLESVKEPLTLILILTASAPDWNGSPSRLKNYYHHFTVLLTTSIFWLTITTLTKYWYVRRNIAVVGFECHKISSSRTILNIQNNLGIDFLVVGYWVSGQLDGSYIADTRYWLFVGCEEMPDCFNFIFTKATIHAIGFLECVLPAYKSFNFSLKDFHQICIDSDGNHYV